MDLRKKQALVVGLGKTGVSCARFLASQGAFVTGTDQRKADELAGPIQEMAALEIKTVLGGHPSGLFEAADIIVISPGVPHTLGPLQEARKRGAWVTGEVELASRFITEPIIAITGTNGKTTTTTLAAEMMRASGLSVFVGGNIGTPLIDYVLQGNRADRLIVEVSSFQLDTIDRFRPDVAVLLNVTEDHLDRYPDFQGYAESKLRIFMNQRDADVAILNGKDPSAYWMLPRIRATRLLFNPVRDDSLGARLDGRRMVLTLPGRQPVEIDLSDLKLVGAHNVENTAAAALAVLSAGGSPEGLRQAIRSFEGLHHRIEYVDTVNGVRYYDDSKATNVDGVARALEGFSGPVVLIMGGRGKGTGYSYLEKFFPGRVKNLIVLGETADAIAADLGSAACGATKVNSMEDAVETAYRLAVPGDVVLLSPACASFDMFRDYAHRGRCFQAAVRGLTHRSV